MMDYKCSRDAEERSLQTGHQEIEGISLGYLRVDGRQMFALAQVVSDLFKDIPRATVNKKMEILQIKSRRCDLEELRSLKAINSVPSRAVKCSLISKEDLDILCMSCRAPSPNRRKRKKKYRRRALQTADFFYTSLYKKPRELLARTSELAALYAQTSSLHSKPSLNGAKFCSPTTSLPPVSVSRSMLNYEKNGKGTNGYNLGGRVDFFSGVPSSCQRTHLSPVGGHGASNPAQSMQQFWNKKQDQCTDHRAVQGFFKDHKTQLRCHIQKTVVRKKKYSSLRGPKKRQGTSAGYSSDSNSSLDFDKDSDFRSNGSSSTESSDEDNGEEGLSSASSAGCSSSDSDSSSLCSGDSVQSTRFRQAILASLGSRLGTSKDTSGSTQERLAGPSHTKITQSTPQNHVPIQPLQVESKFSQDPQHEWNSQPASNLDSSERTQRNSEENAEFGHLGSLTTEATPINSAILDNSEMCTDRVVLPKELPSHTPRREVEDPVPDCTDVTSLHHDDPAITDTPDFSSLSHGTAPSSSPIETAAADQDEVAPEAECGTATQSCCPDTTLGPPEGGFEDPRRENFDRLIRQSKLWCYAKGFNVDGKELRLGIPKTSKNYYDCVESKSSAQKRTRRRSSSLGNGIKNKSKKRRRSRNKKADKQQSGTTANSQKRKGRKARNASPNCKRVRSSISAQSSGTNSHSFQLMAHFPCPPSLVVGEDGDLQPACSLVTNRTKQFPVSPFHPVWYWQLGATVPLGLHSFGFHGYKPGNS